MILMIITMAGKKRHSLKRRYKQGIKQLKDTTGQTQNISILMITVKHICHIWIKQMANL